MIYNSTSRTLSEEYKSTNSKSSMSIAALCTTAKIWKQSDDGCVYKVGII